IGALVAVFLGIGSAAPAQAAGFAPCVYRGCGFGSAGGTTTAAPADPQQVSFDQVEGWVVKDPASIKKLVFVTNSLGNVVEVKVERKDKVDAVATVPGDAGNARLQQEAKAGNVPMDAVAQDQPGSGGSPLTSILIMVLVIGGVILLMRFISK